MKYILLLQLMLISLSSFSQLAISETKTNLPSDQSILLTKLDNIRLNKKRKRSELNSFSLFLETGYKISEGFSINTIAGKYIGKNDQLFTGLGFGYESYHENYQVSTIPIYLSIRGSINAASFSAPDDLLNIFWLSEFGYSLLLIEDPQAIYDESGIMFNVGLGGILAAGSNVNFSFSTSYRRQRFSTRDSEIDYIGTVDLKVGIYFIL